MEDQKEGMEEEMVVGGWACRAGGGSRFLKMRDVWKRDATR